MFQTYDPPATRHDGAERVEKLRDLMAKAKIDALLVPRADEHQGEYVAPSSERLKWLTGFSGSAGLGVVGRSAAVLFVDGRYVVQAPTQVDTRIFEVLQIPQNKLHEWLGKHVKSGGLVGFDPRLHTAAMIEDLANALKPKGIKLRAISGNPVDRAWGRERPPPPLGPVIPHPLKYAGRAAERKIADLQATLRKEGEDAAILTLPDSIAWLFNIRGSDVAHNPVALAFAFVPVSGKPELFIDPAKIGPDAKVHLAPLVKIAEPAALERRLSALKGTNKRIRLDPNTASDWFFRRLKGGKARIVHGPDPCLLPKARKNAAEIKGARIAHERDGAAVVRFLAWLDREATSGQLDEIAAARKLETIRSETQALKEISFDTISGAGPNAAIVHYRVTTPTNRKLGPGNSILSIPAPSTSTARRTLPERSRSGYRHEKCRSGLRLS